MTKSVRKGEHMTDTITLHAAANSRTVREHLEDLLVKVRNVEISVVRTEGADAVVSLTVVVGNLTFTADRKVVK